MFDHDNNAVKSLYDTAFLKFVTQRGISSDIELTEGVQFQEEVVSRIKHAPL